MATFSIDGTDQHFPAGRPIYAGKSRSEVMLMIGGRHLHGHRNTPKLVVTDLICSDWYISQMVGVVYVTGDPHIRHQFRAAMGFFDEDNALLFTVRNFRGYRAQLYWDILHLPPPPPMPTGE